MVVCGLLSPRTWGLHLTSSAAKVPKTVPGIQWGLFSQFFFSHHFIWAVEGAVGTPEWLPPTPTDHVLPFDVAWRVGFVSLVPL